MAAHVGGTAQSTARSAHLDGVAVVLHADGRVAVPAHVHRRVGAVLDLLLGRRRRLFGIERRVLQVIGRTYRT